MLTKNRLPALLELVFLLGGLAFGGFLVLSDAALSRGPGGSWLAPLFVLVFLVFVGRRVYRLLSAVLSEETLIFYRTTGRVVYEGQVVCALSEIDHVAVEDQRSHRLSLVLKDGRQIAVFSSLWEAPAEAAEAIATFAGVEAISTPES